jgi:ankyrin repeat protein
MGLLLGAAPKIAFLSIPHPRDLFLHFRVVKKDSRQRTENKDKEPSEVYPSASLLRYCDWRADGSDFPTDQPELMKALLEHGADPNAADKDGRNLIHLVCQFDHSKTLIVLLEHGVNPNATDEAGWTSLHYACQSHSLEIIKVLLEHGADPNVKERHYGRTPLLFTSRDCAKLLLEHGADANASGDDGETALLFLSNPPCADPDGDRHFDSSYVKLLLQHGARVSIKLDGRNALDGAKQTEYKAIIPMLEDALKKEQAQQKSSATPESR